MFFIKEGATDIVQREMAVEGSASVIFRTRIWWEFDIDGKRYKPSSSYCIALNNNIVIDKEHLSLSPADGNTGIPLMGKPVKRYDTFDKANEQLLRKGYRCHILDDEERGTYVTGYSGLSGAVMLLNYFKTADETMEFLQSAPDEKWGESMLFGLLSAYLAATSIQEFYKDITGKEYTLPALPDRSTLERLCEEKQPLLSADRTFDWIYKIDAKLRAAL